MIISLIFIILYVFLETKIVKYNSVYQSNVKEIQGIVLEMKIDGDKLSFLVKAQEKVQVSYYFKNKEEKETITKNLKFGSLVKISGDLDKPSNNTIPNTFNYKKYLYNNKIYWSCKAREIAINNDNIKFIYQIKNKIAARVAKLKLVSGYMQAFILGDNGYIDSDVYETFRNNGVTHLFAVSGMHISFLVGILSSALLFLKIKEKYVNVMISIFLFFYMFLVGFTASVVRASLLYLFLLVNKKLKLNLKSMEVLYLLFGFLLVINPFYIYDVGFLYSFLTSFGLMLFSKKIIGGYIKKLFLVSLVAFIFSLPVTLANNYEFNVLTVFNNILIVPLISLFLFPFTLITFIIPFLEYFLMLGFNLLEMVNTFCEFLSFNIVVPKINFGFIVLYYSLVGLIYKRGFKFVCLIILLVFLFKLTIYFDKKSYIYYLDVGQGDSSLIISENRKDVIMIDSGGKIEYAKEEWKKKNKEYSLADNIVLFLKSLGISRIDLFVGTHGDVDHVGYAKEILQKIKVQNIMLNNNANNNYEKELLKLGPKKINNNYIKNNIKIYNLNNEKYPDENDSSLVLLVNMANNNFLFMGDAPKKVEQKILEKYNISTTLIKVGHHGSKTSSDFDFLKKFRAQYAIISAGRNNRYGHPAPETIETLKKLNIKYFSTQDKGTICVSLKSNKINFKFYTLDGISF